VANQSGASGTSTRSDAFSVLGRFVVRAPWLMIAAWVAVVGVLAVAFPPLTKVVESQTVQALPPKDMAAAEQMAKDFGESAQNVLIVVLTDNRGLQPGDEDAYRKLAATLRGDSNDVTGVQDVRTTPALRPMMVSADNKAFYMAVNLRAPPGSPESSRAYQRITEIAKRSTAGSPLIADVTGQAAMVGDLSIVSARDMHRIEIATALLVLIILLVIYRRLVTVLLPLITIGVSVASAQGVVSALTQLGLGVSAMTIALMTAMIVGAGTDYAVFLISRYHEYIRSGIDSDLAVQRALSSIGKVIAASAATVVITFCGMVFTRLPAFTSAGPALAVSIGIAFLAAVTLLPAILVLAGRRGWVTPRRALTGRLWQRSAIQIVRRPKAHLLISLSVLIALAACAAFLRPTFNDRLQLPQKAQSNVGFSTMENHFSTSTLLPQYIYVRAPQDLRTSRVLADLDQMAQRVSQLPNIAAVRGITRPTGQPLDQTKLSFQAGEVGTNLENASTRISDRSTDLDALTGGADQLAASLAEVRDQIRSASGPMTQLTATLNQVQQQLATAAQLLDSIRGLANTNGSVLTLAASVVDSAGPMIDALNNSRQCSADPACSAGRSNLEGLVQARNNGTLDTAQSAAAQNVQSTVQHLSALLATAGGSLRAPGINSLAGVPQRIAQMQEGADALADGSQRLDQGVRALVDQTKQMGLGLNQAADLLLSMKRDASQTSMAGMYIPPKVLTSDDFNNAAKMFISPDGHSVRYVVETKFDPFSPAAMDQVKSILNTVRGAQPNTSLSRAEISVVGPTAMYSAIRSYYDDDVRLIVMMTLLVVFAILVLLLRAIVAPLYLIASVVISFLSAVGVGVVFFQFVLHQAIYWNVQAMAFIVLVAVGADYNLLLITRIREESGSGIRSGIIRAVRSTGGVITSAGIIFAASMFGLLFGSLSTMVQTGFIIGVGLLIDTFVVRTITVPALAALIGRANWWPSKPTAAKVASSDIPIAAETSAADIGFSDVRKARSTSCLVGKAAIERAEGRSRGEAHTTQVFSGSALSPPASARGAALIKRGDCSLGAFSVWLHDLLDELDISRVTLVGQSLGGDVAMQFVHQHPDCCERLVLIGSGGLGPEVGWTPRLLSAPGAESLLPVIAPPAVVAFGDQVWSWLAPLGVPCARAAEACSAYSSLSDLPARAAFLRSLRSVVDQRGQAVSACNRLHFSSGLPTLLIWGDHDRINPIAHAGSELLRHHDPSLSVPSVVGPLRNISRNLPICSSSPLASTAESTGSRLT
jgi:RND superfamily putative drug exporter